MSQHSVRIQWTASDHPSQPGTYSRDHTATISPEVTIPVSAAAAFLGNDTLADPEQLLVNALASCHMLYFLAVCEGSGFKIESYEDEAVGHVEKSADGSQWVSAITISPKVTFGGSKTPDHAALERLHHRAHKGCFIANSIKSNVTINVV
ncbi:MULTISPECIES: OsmC family protein [unclassified Aureimonas]|uniref:OsmC family protein n=1 Tax=unclassified Aureimonas TaxID=2615206 RepID=UPI0006F46ED4|nr:MULTISPECIES: OsmC family protein [unclassified Aureimonas]KQT62907.1 redox protein [Aureimonas sp. Leaf427]KQT74856.1 redox protein [Aureimonas sp. Leaf460]